MKKSSLYYKRWSLYLTSKMSSFKNKLKYRALSFFFLQKQFQHENSPFSDHESISRSYLTFNLLLELFIRLFFFFFLIFTKNNFIIALFL